MLNIQFSKNNCAFFKSNHQKSRFQNLHQKYQIILKEWKRTVQSYQLHNMNKLNVLSLVYPRPLAELDQLSHEVAATFVSSAKCGVNELTRLFMISVATSASWDIELIRPLTKLETSCPPVSAIWGKLLSKLLARSVTMVVRFKL